MAMYLGSFSQGLFGGAQSAFQLYSMYQGIRAQQEGVDALDKRDQIAADQKQMDEVNKASPGWNTGTHTPGVRRMDVQPGTSEQPATATPASEPAPGVNTERVKATGFGPAIAGRPLPTPPIPPTPGTSSYPIPPIPPHLLPPSQQQRTPDAAGPGNHYNPNTQQWEPDAYPSQPNESGPAYPFERQMPNPYSDYGPAIPTPQPPPGVTSADVYQPRSMPARRPDATGPGNHYNPVTQQWEPDAPPTLQTPGLTRTASNARRQMVEHPQPPPPPAPPPSVTQPVGGYFGPNGPYPQQRPPISQPGGPYQPPPQQMPARPPPPHEPYGPETPPGSDSVPASPVTQPAGGYLGPNGPYPQQPPPSGQPGGPYQPPPQQAPYQPYVPQMQPGGGSVGVGGTPQAQAEPSVGGRILGVVGNALSAINPIGSAHAATMAPNEMYGGVGAPTNPSVFEQGYNALQKQPQNTSPMAPQQMYGGETVPVAGPPPPPAAKPGAPAAAPAAPAGPYQPYEGVAPAPPAQATGITPATPPSGAPGQTPTPPVAVPGKEGQVAPSGQQGPSVQSEYTPVVTSPPVSPVYWDHFAKTNPDLAARIERQVAKYGGNAVSKYDVAAIIYRESKGDPNAQAKGAMGEGQGLMQIEPGTQAAFNEGGRLKPFNPDDNIAMGVKYLKYLALDKGLGTGSTQMHLAYMRGEKVMDRVRAAGGWERYAEQNHIARDGVNMLYENKLKIHDGMLTGGGGNMNAPGVVQAAETGPDGLLSYMAESGPPGMGMSDRWRQVQSLLEHSAIRSGKGVEALGPIQDWVAQQAHQGAVSNLLSAYQSLSAGNGVSAVSALAKAHAFFPDDTYGRFGVDKKGQVWAEQFSEVTGQSMGKPFQITKDMLAQQVLALQHPHNFIEALQKYQNANADIVLKGAHAKYYSEMPAIARENAELKADTQVQIAGIRTDAQRLIQQNKQDYDAAKAALHEQSMKGINDSVEKHYGADVEVPKGATPETWAAESEVFKSLISPHSMGGANLGPLQAKAYAGQLRTGKLAITRGVDPATGKPVDAIHSGDDPKKGSIKTFVTPEQGDHMRVLLGLPAVAGSKPIAPPAAPAQRATGPVGAGLGSQAALNSGYNTFTGLPTRPMQQQQATV